MVKLLIVRHGYSVSNKSRTFCGQVDVDLSEEGFKQAELVSDYLLKTYKIDAIYSSDLKRAVKTVKKVSEELNIPIITDKALREINAGKWEDVKFDMLEKEYGEQFRAWINDKTLINCPDGESLMDVHKRSLEFITKICKENEGKTILIATHGGVILPFQCFVQGIDMKKIDTIPWAPNASLSIFNYDNGKFTDEKIGIVDYLNELKTYFVL